MNKLHWIQGPAPREWRGVLESDRATTLALIKEKGPTVFELKSAFTRDDAEPRILASFEQADAKAQSEIAEWVWRHAFEFVPSETTARNVLANVRAALLKAPDPHTMGVSDYARWHDEQLKPMLKAF